MPQRLRRFLLIVLPAGALGMGVIWFGWLAPSLAQAGLSPAESASVGRRLLGLALALMLAAVGAAAAWLRLQERRRATAAAAWREVIAAYRAGKPESALRALPNQVALGSEFAAADVLTLLEESRQQRGGRDDRRRHRGALLDALLNRLDDGVVLAAADGRILFYNQAMRSLYGWDDPGGLAPQWQPRERPRLADRIGEEVVLETFARAGKSGSRETATYRLDHDPERVLHISCYPTASSDGEMLLVVRDVTQQHALERHRQQFVANVSHELRTPLAAILGYIETLIEDGLEEPDEARRFLRIVQRNAARLDALIADLLELSRLDAEGRDPHYADPIDLRRALARLLEVVGPRAAEKGITIEVALPDDLPRILGARRPVEQIGLNLLSNAVHYSDNGTTIRVEASVEAATVTMRVVDQGIGIEPEHLERIFERFYRIDKDRSRAAGGTGLGLSIVKHLASRCDAAVWAESKVGEGSTFYVCWRRASS